MWGHGLDLAGSEKGQVAGAFECGSDASGSIIYGEFDMISYDMIYDTRYYMI